MRIPIPDIGKKIDHKLKKNKKTGIPRYIVCFDTEAWIEPFPEGQIQKLRLGWIVFYDRKTKKEIWKYFERKEEFWEFLKEIAKPNSRILVFAHNLDYDFQIVGGFNEALRQGFRLKNVPIIDNKNFIVKFTYEFLRKRTGKPTKCSFVFISTTNYIRAPLSKIAEALGLKKLDKELGIDFDRLNSIPNEKLSRYCKEDVRIVLKFVLFLIDFIKKHDLGNFQPTIAKQAFTSFRHKFLKEDIYIHANPLATALERISYKGGRTEAFRIGKIEGEVFDLDVNSMYPYVMKTNVFPVKLLNVIKQGNKKRLLNLINQGFLVIAHVKVRTRTPCLGIRDEETGKLIFPVGEFEGVFTSPEIQLLLEEGGEILEVYEIAVYEGKKIFDEYVSFFYELKKKYKSEGNGAFYLLTKLFLNSLYGKFGQRIEKWDYLGETDEQGLDIEQIYDSDRKEWHYILKVNGKAYERSKRYIESFNSFVAIASFVTAYARCLLYRYMKIAGLENVYYCDTDSLFVNSVGYERLKRHGAIDDLELGKLKVEDIGKNVIIYGVKDYVFNKKTKLKGVKKGAKKIEENKFEQKQFVSTRTHVKKYSEIEGVIVRTVIKELRREYDKGIVLLDGKVIPYVFEGQRDQYLLPFLELEEELKRSNFDWIMNLKKEVLI